LFFKRLVRPELFVAVIYGALGIVRIGHHGGASLLTLGVAQGHHEVPLRFIVYLVEVFVAYLMLLLRVTWGLA
jgi:hypothetical protein